MVGVRGWLEARRKATANSGQGHLPTAWVAILLLEVIVLLLGPVLWAVGGWDLIGDKTRLALDAFDAISEPDKKIEAYGKLVSTIGLLAAAPIGMIGVGLAFWRTWNQHRDGTTAIRKLDAEAYAKAAEAFAKAVEQLSHKEPYIRTGAVLALEAVGKSTPRLLSQAIEVLCFYVRETQPVSAIRPMVQTPESSPYPPFPTDIQLILDIVNRLKRGDKDNQIKIDLSHVDLRGASLSGANLSGADLRRANLSWAKLNGANLRATNLLDATLNWADLQMTNLHEAYLCGASLKGGHLREATLKGADLRGANLWRADLTEADLKDAKIADAEFADANLTDTIFQDTTLPDGRVWTGEGPPPDLAPSPVTNA